MLAVARILRTGANLLLLDEPSAALSPKVVGEIADIIRDLRQRGLSILLVEQNVAMALELADEIHILREGRVAHSLKAPKVMRFKDKNVIVTGAARGIGRATVERFVAEG
eukprot:gene27783-31385_t